MRRDNGAELVMPDGWRWASGDDCRAACLQIVPFLDWELSGANRRELEEVLSKRDWPKRPIEEVQAGFAAEDFGKRMRARIEERKVADIEAILAACKNDGFVEVVDAGGHRATVPIDVAKRMVEMDRRGPLATE